MEPVLGYKPPTFMPNDPDWEGSAPGWMEASKQAHRYISEKLPAEIVGFEMPYEQHSMSGGLLDLLMWRLHGEGIGFGFYGDQWIGMGSWKEVGGKRHHIWVEGDSHLLCVIETYHYWWKKLHPDDAKGF